MRALRPAIAGPETKGDWANENTLDGVVEYLVVIHMWR